MKHLKKVLVALCAFVLALGVVTPAFAADGSITIVDPASNASYKAYKIFDVAADANGNLSYTLPNNSAWESVLLNDDGSSKIEGLGFTKNDNDSYSVKKLAGFNAADFAKTLKDNKSGKVSNPTDDSWNGSKKAFAPGYYFVIGSANDAQGSLTTVKDSEDVTIQDKSNLPFDKVIKADDKQVKIDDVQIGDEIEYVINAKVPYVSSEFDSYTYRVSDTMGTGLEFVAGSLIVKVDNVAVDLVTMSDGSALSGDSISYKSGNKGFDLSLEMINATTTNGTTVYTNKYAADTPITITYKANVTKDALHKVSENKAVLEYGHDTDITSKDSSTQVYNSRIVIDKYQTGAPEQKVAGAKFVLKNSEGKYYKATKDNDDKVTGISWESEIANDCIVTTDSNGAAAFQGLADGTYTLVETEAPAGYTKLAEDITVVVAGDDATTVGLSTSQIADALTNIAHVANTPGTILPSTGGMGTMLLYIAGGAGLVVYLLTSRRKKAVQE